MLPEIAAALSSATHATKIVRGLSKLSRDSEINVAVIDLQQTILELQSKIIEIQAKYDELAASKEEVAAKLTRYEDWERQAARYQLHELVQGIFVYTLKPGQEMGEPAHYLCPNCFQDRQRSILHKPSASHTNHVCDRCKFDARPATASFESVRVRSRIEGL